MKLLLRNNRLSHIHLSTNDVPTEILLCRVLSIFLTLSYNHLHCERIAGNWTAEQCMWTIWSQIIFESFGYFYSGITSCRLDHGMDISFNFDIFYKKGVFFLRGGGWNKIMDHGFFTFRGTSLLFKHLFLFLLKLDPPMYFRTCLISHTKRAPLKFVH